MATYFIAVEDELKDGIQHKANAILKNCDLDPTKDEFLLSLTAKIAKSLDWPADKTLITSLSKLED